MKPDPKNKQQVFDYVVRKLAEQGTASVRDLDGACQYRGEEGCKCAVGWLVSDEEYDPAWDRDGISVTDGWPGGPRDLLEEKGYELMFLRALQRAHDRTVPPKAGKPSTFKTWRTNFTKAAEDHGLNPRLAKYLFRQQP